MAADFTLSFPLLAGNGDQLIKSSLFSGIPPLASQIKTKTEQGRAYLTVSLSPVEALRFVQNFSSRGTLGYFFDANGSLLDGSAEAFLTMLEVERARATMSGSTSASFKLADLFTPEQARVLALAGLTHIKGSSGDQRLGALDTILGHGVQGYLFDGDGNTNLETGRDYYFVPQDAYDQIRPEYLDQVTAKPDALTLGVTAIQKALKLKQAPPLPANATLEQLLLARAYTTLQEMSPEDRNKLQGEVRTSTVPPPIPVTPDKVGFWEAIEVWGAQHPTLFQTLTTILVLGGFAGITAGGVFLTRRIQLSRKTAQKQSKFDSWLEEAKRNVARGRDFFKELDAVDMTAEAGAEKYEYHVEDPETLRLMENVFTRRDRQNNLFVVRESGSGKSTDFEILARAIADGTSSRLRGRRVISIKLSKLVGAQGAEPGRSGQFEQRVLGVMEQAKREGNVILFFDEAALIKMTGTHTGRDAGAEMEMLEYLGRGEVPTAFATTTLEYREKFPAGSNDPLVRRCELHMGLPPSGERLRKILERQIVAKHQKISGVTVTLEALEVAMRRSHQYEGAAEPSRSIALLDKAVELITDQRAKGNQASPSTATDGKVDADVVNLIVDRHQETVRDRTIVESLGTIRSTQRTLEGVGLDLPLDSAILHEDTNQPDGRNALRRRLSFISASLSPVERLIRDGAPMPTILQHRKAALRIIRDYLANKMDERAPSPHPEPVQPSRDKPRASEPLLLPAPAPLGEALAPLHEPILRDTLARVDIALEWYFDDRIANDQAPIRSLQDLIDRTDPNIALGVLARYDRATWSQSNTSVRIALEIINEGAILEGYLDHTRYLELDYLDIFEQDYRSQLTADPRAVEPMGPVWTPPQSVEELYRDLGITEDAIRLNQGNLVTFLKISMHLSNPEGYAGVMRELDYLKRVMEALEFDRYEVSRITFDYIIAYNTRGTKPLDVADFMMQRTARKGLEERRRLEMEHQIKRLEQEHRIRRERERARTRGKHASLDVIPHSQPAISPTQIAISTPTAPAWAKRTPRALVITDHIVDTNSTFVITDGPPRSMKMDTEAVAEAGTAATHTGGTRVIPLSARRSAVAARATRARTMFRVAM